MYHNNVRRGGMDIEKTGKFIAECRKKKGMTQEQLAEHLNVTNKTVSRWENGNYMPDISLLIPICSILGISLSELLYGDKQNIIELSYRVSNDKIVYDLSPILKQNDDISLSKANKTLTITGSNPVSNTLSEESRQLVDYAKTVIKGKDKTFGKWMIIVGLLFITIVFTLCMYFNNKNVSNDDLGEYLQSSVVSYFDEFGYDENSEYTLEGPYTQKSDEFPQIYVIKENGEEQAGICIEYYEDSDHVGLLYKNGVISCWSGPEVLKMKEGWNSKKKQISINSWIPHEKGVVIDERSYALSEEDILIITELFIEKNKNDDMVRPGDNIAIYGPIIEYYPTYNHQDGYIHLSQPWQKYKFIITVNEDPIFLADYRYLDKNLQTGILKNQASEHQYNIIKETKTFIIIPFISPVTKNSDYYLVTEETEYDYTILPMATRKAMKTVIEKVKTLEPYECIAEFVFPSE